MENSLQKLSNFLELSGLKEKPLDYDYADKENIKKISEGIISPAFSIVENRLQKYSNIKVDIVVSKGKGLLVTDNICLRINKGSVAKLLYRVRFTKIEDGVLLRSEYAIPDFENPVGHFKLAGIEENIKSISKEKLVENCVDCIVDNAKLT